jgi:predicted O-methyltransferase YrrM
VRWSYHRLGGLVNWLPRPLDARHTFWSAVGSTDDLKPPASDELIALMLEAAALAHRLELRALSERCRTSLQRALLKQWPGEHYRFLAALIECIQPNLAIEIGTDTGMGALALAARMPEGGRVVTYDVVSWQEIPQAVICADDYPKVEQRVGDLGREEFYSEQLAVLTAAYVVFLDGPKDGHFESVFLERFIKTVERVPLIILDDIRAPSMLQLWRDLALPKVDATSVGHWSGTGLAGFIP